MKPNSDIKSLYLTLFVLLIIEICLFFFLGFLIAIATFVISLILYKKFPKNCGIPKGLALALITSGFHLVIPFIGNFLIFISPPMLFLIFSCNVAIFIYLIVACVKVYKEYAELFN